MVSASSISCAAMRCWSCIAQIGSATPLPHHGHTHTHTLSLSLLTNFLRDCITSSMSSSTSWWDSTDLHLTIASEMRRKGGGGDGSVCGHSVRLYPNLPSSCSFSMVVFTSVLISTTVAELLPWGSVATVRPADADMMYVTTCCHRNVLILGRPLSYIRPHLISTCSWWRYVGCWSFLVLFDWEPVDWHSERSLLLYDQ